MNDPRAVVIATHNRPKELLRCVEAIAPQVDVIVVVDNASDPPVNLPERIPGGRDPYDVDTVHVYVLRDPEQPPNLSRLWNVGLNWVADYFAGGDINYYDVAIVNDDATVPAGWFDALSGWLRNENVQPLMAACSTPPFDELPAGHRRFCDASSPMSVYTRLTGWAFVLRGEWEGARFDERLRWWYADDMISLRAREAGGLVQVGGFPVPNEHADQSTIGVLAEQAGRDRATFIEITGRQPW